MDKEKVQFQFTISRKHFGWLKQNRKMTSQVFCRLLLLLFGVFIMYISGQWLTTNLAAMLQANPVLTFTLAPQRAPADWEAQL